MLCTTVRAENFRLPAEVASMFFQEHFCPLSFQALPFQCPFNESHLFGQPLDNADLKPQQLAQPHTVRVQRRCVARLLSLFEARRMPI